MVVTVSALRGIQHAELEIPRGLARVCGDTGSGKTSPLKVVFLPSWGRSFLMGDSEHLIDHGQDHLRVIARRWPFWTSRWLAFEVSRDGASARILARRAATTRRSGSLRRTDDSH